MSGLELHAPHVLDTEVANALRRVHLRGDLADRRGREALDDFVDLEIVRYPHTSLLPRIWEMRRNVTAYDACYVALAEALDVPLVTADARLAAASGHRARIELLTA